jgi:hypothetical protein
MEMNLPSASAHCSVTRSSLSAAKPIRHHRAGPPQPRVDAVLQEGIQMSYRSWIIIAICAVLLGFLALGYFETRPDSDSFAMAQAVAMLNSMKTAMHDKSVDGIMRYIDERPDERLAGISPAQIRALLANFFRQSGDVDANYSHLQLTSGPNDTWVEFDVTIKNALTSVGATDYTGHVTMHMTRVEVPRLLGMFHAMEWRIVQATTTGPQLNEFGDN